MVIFEKNNKLCFSFNRERPTDVSEYGSLAIGLNEDKEVEVLVAGEPVDVEDIIVKGDEDITDEPTEDDPTEEDPSEEEPKEDEPTEEEPKEDEPEHVSGELITDIGDIEFVVGVPTEFTYTTVANDDAGVVVNGASNFSDEDAIELLEFKQGSQWIAFPRGGSFGGSEGFPMTNATSTFRVTFAKAGEFAFTSSMKNVETGEIICSVETTAVVKEPEHVASEVTTDVGEKTFVVGEATEFSFSTVANDDAGIMVVGSGNFSNPEAIEKLEYYEVKNGEWYELPEGSDFGGGNGFPMADATSTFRVTFKTPGIYSFTVSMKKVEDGEVLCEVEATARVSE